MKVPLLKKRNKFKTLGNGLYQEYQPNLGNSHLYCKLRITYNRDKQTVIHSQTEKKCLPFHFIGIMCHEAKIAHNIDLWGKNIFWLVLCYSLY